MAHGYLFRQMDDADAREISGWRYAPPYAFYDATADPANLAELLDPERRRGILFSVLDGKNPARPFFPSRTEKKDEAVDAGLGLKPDLSGKDLGAQFVMSGLAFAMERFSPRPFTHSVATFNGRAIGVYERVGFRRGRTYTHETNGGEHEFLSMWREA